MNKKIILLIIGIFLMTIISADLGTFAKDTCVQVKGNVNSTGVNVTIYYPNSSIAVTNQPMTNLYGNIHNYSFCSTSANGIYIYDYCDAGGGSCYENTFEINYTGDRLDQPQALIYIGLLGILIFLFIASVSGYSLLPKGNNYDGDTLLSINKTKYLKLPLFILIYSLLLAILFVSSNIALGFLYSTMIGDLLFKMFQGLFALALPMVFFIFIYTIVKIYEDREFQTMINRGIQ